MPELPVDAVQQGCIGKVMTGGAVLLHDQFPVRAVAGALAGFHVELVVAAPRVRVPGEVEVEMVPGRPRDGVGAVIL